MAEFILLFAGIILGVVHSHSVGAAIESATSGMSALRIGSQPGQPQCIKLLDENLHWNESALEVGSSTNKLNEVISEVFR